MSLHKEISFEKKSASTSPRMAGSMPKATRPATTGRGRCSRRMCWRGCRRRSRRRGKRSSRTTARRPAKRCSTRLRDQLDQRGTLDVLRHGIELLGLRQPLALAQFKPALAMNPDILARYAANRLRVVRQVHYSLHNENCIDLVLFLNGLPVATVGAEDRLHAERRRRDRPVSLRPPAAAQGPGRRAAAVVSRAARWCISRSATAKCT